MKVYTSRQYIADGCNVGIFRADTSRLYIEPPHKHEFIEIIYILAGSGTELVDNKEYEVHPGDMLFLNYGSIHGFTSKENFSFYNISFLPEVVSRSVITPENAFALLSLTAFEEMRRDQNGGLISFSGKECVEIENILSAMLNEYREQLPSCGKVLESYINILITKMLRKTQPGMGTQETGDIWQELSEYIDQNPGAVLTLSALASKCFYNPSYFSRMFKQKFHMSLTEYVSQKRVEYAIRLLRESDLPVDEISARSGFADRSTFYAAFSKVTGNTPAYYRHNRME